MTKKKSTPSTTTSKKVTKPASKSVRKAKAPSPKKAKADSVTATSKKRGRKPGAVTKKEKVLPSVPAAGEIKVKEIASKTKLKEVEEKRESKGFSLDEVRAILKAKNKKSAPKKKASAKKAVKVAPVENQVVKPATQVSKVKNLLTASVNDILGFGTPSVSTRIIRDEKKVPKDLVPYYENLMSLRTSLKGALGERSQDTLGAKARESSGELSLNSSDAGSETFNRDVALSMVANEQEALEEIEDAIDRIFDGTFGICQETHKPIKKARLKVVPFTRFSLEGQTLHEQSKRKDVDKGGGTFATISDSTMGVEE
ncbi:MAG: hypothetical protein P8N49_07355 [Opitutales bacterium]|nr:hypothetical protein [Opitutales bacterium]